MDITGGILSITQMLLELILIKNALLNSVKIGLGITSLVFDAIFILQHYYLYPKISSEIKNPSYEKIEK